MLVYLRLTIFSIRQLSMMAQWHAGAELDGSEELRHRAVRHRLLHDEAVRAIRAKLCLDLARLAGRLPLMAR